MDPGGTTDSQGGLPAEGAVIKKGYLKKLKTMKKKFFVLKGDSPEKSARLEYYDTEKKWKSHTAPKKSILLKNCFNITRRLDVRQKHVIALYTRKECLCIVAESEDELGEWLAALLELLHPEDALLNTPQPSQLIWQVNIQKKGLGASRNIVGNYTLRLTDKSLILTKLRPSKLPLPQASPPDYIEYSLSSIRRCGDSESFFYMEVGRSSVTGAGELWMHTEDPNIAKSVHTTVLIAMHNSLNVKEELDPKSRMRSASATEASKPISVLTRRQTHQGTKSHGLSPSSESTFCSGRSCVGLCISPCENQSAAYCAPQTVQETQEVTPMAPQPPGTHNGTNIQREDSIMLNVSHERTRSLPITGEEETISIPSCNLMKTRSVDKAGSLSECPVDKRLSQCNGSYLLSKRRQMVFAGGRRASTGCRLGQAPQLPSPHTSCLGSGHGIMVSGGSVRERCDSLPSRGNTPGLGGAGNGCPRVPPHPPGVTHRPHSMYIRGISHSPPANSPLSPHSAGAYSTDSAGSSVSIDEPDFSHHSMFMDDPSHTTHTRLINSRTPDERSIPEEGADDSLVLWQPEKCHSESVEKGNTQKLLYASLEKSFSTFGSGIVKDVHSMRKSSIGGLPEVSSPIQVPNTGTSSEDQSGYMPMSPASAEPIRLVHSRVGGNSSNHSRTSSMAEDTPDGGVKTEEGYVDMEPNKEGVPHTMSPAASISSVMSGTPSTDIRFSEFHLDKVSSYFAPEEDGGSRPLRAYSVGSRPDHVKKVINRHDVHMSAIDSSRTRAFSCGSKSRNNRDNRILNHGTPPHSHLQHLMSSANSGTKSSSTPILGTGGSLYRHTYNSSHSSVEPLDDLMEMDFSNRTDSSSSVKTEVPPAPAPAPAPPPPSSNTDGYMDMAPVGSSSGYVEMKPADSCPQADAATTHKLLVEAVRKISITKPHYDSLEKIPTTKSLQPQPPTADGYVEMSWNNAKAVSGKSRSRVPSLPIAISNSNNPKDVKNQTASSASPIFSMASMLKGENEKADMAIPQATPPKMSPGTSPASAFTPSPMSSLKKSKKQQNRRNSAELSTPTSAQPQTIFPFSPSSPVKPSKSPLYQPERKLDSCGAGDSTQSCNPYSIERTIANSFDVSAYMEMAPARLSTVKEINETCGMKSPVDKNLKQIMNNATKVSSDNKATSQFTQQRSVEECTTRNKPSNGSQSNVPSKFQYMPIKVPPFTPSTVVGSRNMDSNSKENQDILSSNPTATRTLAVSNPSAKPNTNANQVQLVRKPILVISQTQAIPADFKPIPAYEIEQKTTKSGSPKQCESALNRQLTYFDNKNRVNKEDPCDGYETLSAQNGQLQKVTSSRPGSVNNNKGKKEGGSGSRPPSVNSEGGGVKEKSRPSSVSSEIGGTPCGSRPNSVMDEREKLLYVSLDLNPATAVGPRQPPVGGVYSTIDFVKCEELKNSKNLAAKGTN